MIQWATPRRRTLAVRHEGGERRSFPVTHGKRTCSIPGCERPHEARGWCNTHYERWRQHGTTDLLRPVYCSVSGCDRHPHGHGLCERHYRQRERRGWAETAVCAPPTTEERFWKYVQKTDECWLWTGGLDAHGYGRFRAGRMVGAHVYAYTIVVGSVPPGLELDHLCRNPPCVRPDHLEPVTHTENMRRGFHAQKQTCKHGHVFSPGNTRMFLGRRVCRLCERRRERAYHQRKAAARTIPLRPPCHLRTHCPQGHPFDAENTRRSDGQRKCRACLRARGQRYRQRQKEARETAKAAEGQP